MQYGNWCGYYCEPEEITDEDRKAMLKEQEAILEAKLATVRHLRETVGKEKKSNASKE